MKKCLLFALLFCVGAASSAGEAASASSDITPEDRLLMMEGAERYNACLHKESDVVFNDHADVRKVADVAMGRCQPTLDELDKMLAKRLLNPDFRASFVRHTRIVTARKLLPELMARKAAEQSPEP